MLKKQRSIFKRLAAQVHQMINHIDRAEINRKESRCRSLFERPGVSLPDAYHFNLSLLLFFFLFFYSASFSLVLSHPHCIYCMTQHLIV